MEKDDFIHDYIKNIVISLKENVMTPLKDLLLFSRIIKKKFRPNFSLFIQCVENLAFFTEIFHYLKRHSKSIKYLDKIFFISC